MVRARQERKTFEDVVDFQNELLHIIRRKERTKSPLTESESEKVRFLYPRSILSHGSSKVYFKNSDGRVISFRHITEFIENLLNVRTSKVELIDGITSIRYVVPIEKLWMVLRNELVYLFPFAREEAIHMSPESITRESATAYKFSLDEKLGDD